MEHASAACIGSGISRQLRNDAAISLSMIFVAALVFYLVAASVQALAPSSVFAAGCLLLVIFALVMHGLEFHSVPRFGVANRVTAVRASIISLVSAIIVFDYGAATPDRNQEFLIGLVALALLLDGIDGYLARRFRLESELGWRFDMELDAFLILALSAACYLLDKAGWWVLLVGLMRYVFIIAQRAYPALKRPLPPSFRRKLICVYQVVALLTLLLPFVVPPASIVIAASALVLLVYSFATDVLFLVRADRVS
ncbi:CDP-alcohol phosphatidyltransferase family protein [Pseudohoeflea suaedae]|uniref:CDP-alcohol phosphatidyltransferase family protein n=2 Tax=Pseudohoeflea suaedae TaxID=877384 RepID=A0A4R5PJ79_9HYPH|nr:CDP-alcohol phosphatidyltransferase family protein [Pseudohoeflea suaedae]